MTSLILGLDRSINSFVILINISMGRGERFSNGYGPARRTNQEPQNHQVRIPLSELHKIYSGREASRDLFGGRKTSPNEIGAAISGRRDARFSEIQNLRWVRQQLSRQQTKPAREGKR